MGLSRLPSHFKLRLSLNFDILNNSEGKENVKAKKKDVTNFRPMFQKREDAQGSIRNKKNFTYFYQEVSWENLYQNTPQKKNEDRNKTDVLSFIVQIFIK